MAAPKSAESRGLPGCAISACDVPESAVKGSGARRKQSDLPLMEQALALVSIPAQWFCRSPACLVRCNAALLVFVPRLWRSPEKTPAAEPLAAGRQVAPSSSRSRIVNPRVSSLLGRRREAASKALTPYIEYARGRSQSRIFGRRQAHGVSESSEPSTRFSKFGRRQAHGAHKLKEPDVLLPRVQHVAEAPRSGAECFDTTYRAPANWLPMLARGAHKLNEPDVRLPHVQRVGKAPLRAECFDTTYGVPASGPLMLLGRRQAHPTPHILTPRAMFRLRSPSRAPLCGAKT
ncbi:hypothetical protein C8R47DRAFT_1085110 [Mycena vitilis]|nr:hypothetical protein C8R47DRAFT_1085110 [Mycena vitilis]